MTMTESEVELYPPNWVDVETGQTSAIDKKKRLYPISPSVKNVITRWFIAQVDQKKCIPISIYSCFLSGFTAAPSFSACYIWCAFQTGNLAQLGVAAAESFSPNPEYKNYIFKKTDQQALTSLLAFLIGTSLGRIGDKLGARTRQWLVGATIIQALLTMAAALTAHYSPESGIATARVTLSWTGPLGMATLALLSASMGIQGVIGIRTSSPMNTTLVLTTTWIELLNDPFLFSLRGVPSRDIRIWGVVVLFLGALFSRAILQSPIGQAGCLGVLTGLRVIQAGWWLLTPEERKEEQEEG